MLSEAVYTLRQYTLAHPYSGFSNPSAESNYCPAILHMGTDLHIFLFLGNTVVNKLRRLQMKPLDSKKDYQNYVDKKSPNSPIWKNCFNAFWVGGLICTIGPELQPLKKESDCHHL